MNPKIQSAPADQAALEKRFEELAAQWLENVQWFSFQHQRVPDPAYQEIIAMGWPVLPFLISRLEHDYINNQGPHNWFAALRAITGIWPTDDKAAFNDSLKMSEAWLKWAKTNNIDWESKQ
jgi:hypothetical protein